MLVSLVKIFIFLARLYYYINRRGLRPDEGEEQIDQTHDEDELHDGVETTPYHTHKKHQNLPDDWNDISEGHETKEDYNESDHTVFILQVISSTT